MVTYWADGQQLCGPKPKDIEDIFEAAKANGGDKQRFWVEDVVFNAHSWVIVAVVLLSYANVFFSFTRQGENSVYQMSAVAFIEWIIRDNITHTTYQQSPQRLAVSHPIQMWDTTEDKSINNSYRFSIHPRGQHYHSRRVLDNSCRPKSMYFLLRTTQLRADSIRFPRRDFRQFTSPQSILTHQGLLTRLLPWFQHHTCR